MATLSKSLYDTMSIYTIDWNELPLEVQNMVKQPEEKPKEAPKVNIYKERYNQQVELNYILKQRIKDLNEGLTQREVRAIVNRALKQKGLPDTLPQRKYPSKTAFVAALSNTLFELASSADPDRLP